MQHSDLENKILEDKIKAQLDASVQNIDADTRKRLADIRRQSLQTDTQTKAPTRWLTLSFMHQHWLSILAMFIATFMVALMLFLPSNAPSNQQDHLAVLEALNNAEDLEIISDPDFYLWANEVLLEDGRAL